MPYDNFEPRSLNRRFPHHPLDLVFIKGQTSSSHKEQCKGRAEKQPGRQHTPRAEPTPPHYLPAQAPRPLMLQVGALEPGSHTGGRAVPAAMSPTSRLISPTPRPRPNHDMQPGLLLEEREGLPSRAGQPPPPFETVRRRHCSAVDLIGPASALQPVLFTVCRLWCRRHLTGATHTSRQAPPSPPHAGVSMPSRSQAKPQHNAGHDIKPVPQRPSYTGKVASP